MTAKQRLKSIIDEQPDDATPEEIIRELAFACMADRGMADARAGRTLSNEELGRRIRQWRK